MRDNLTHPEVQKPLRRRHFSAFAISASGRMVSRTCSRPRTLDEREHGMVSRYPERGESVRMSDGAVYRVQGVTERGDLILALDRRDTVWQAPLEAVVEIVELEQ